MSDETEFARLRAVEKAVWAEVNEAGPVYKAELRAALGTPAPTASTPAAPSVNSGAVPAPTQPTAYGLGGTWSPVFVDDFDGTALDRTKWDQGEPYQRGGTGFTSNGENWFVYPPDSETVSVSGGIATLKVRKRSGLPGQPASAPFTGCLLNTQGKFEVGAGTTSFWESRQKVPSGTGLFLAFWTTGSQSGGPNWPRQGELDFHEFVNNGAGGRGTLNHTMHYHSEADLQAGNANQGHRQVQRYVKDPGLLDAWHTFGFYRSPTEMRLYLDGSLRLVWKPDVTYTADPVRPSTTAYGVPQSPAFTGGSMPVRLDAKVGGEWGGQGLDSSQYAEGDFLVDYVKVWQRTA